MAWRRDIKIFAGSTGKAFAQRMCDYLKVELGKSENNYFFRRQYICARAGNCARQGCVSGTAHRA